MIVLAIDDRRYFFFGKGDTFVAHNYTRRCFLENDMIPDSIGESLKFVDVVQLACRGRRKMGMPITFFF